MTALTAADQLDRLADEIDAEIERRKRRRRRPWWLVLLTPTTRTTQKPTATAAGTAQKIGESA